jgi:hypothetical protein
MVRMDAHPRVTCVGSSRPGVLSRLGWRHHGFRASSRWSAILGLVLVLAGPFVMDMVSSRYHRPRSPDLHLWRAVAADFLTHPAERLYERHPEYIYPPFFLTLVWPLARLPGPAAEVLFQTLQWVALFFCLRIAWRLCSREGEDQPPLVALGSLLLIGRFIQNDLAHSNINLFLLLAVLGGCQQFARGRPWTAGALIGLAACVKVTPALLLVCFLCRRQWRPLAGAALMAVICLLIWPAAWCGWGDNWRTLWEWYDHVIRGYVPGEIWSIHINQSLGAILNRLLGPAVAIDPDIHVAVVVLPRWALNLTRTLLTLGILGVLLQAWRPRVSTPRAPLTFSAEIALAQIAMLLLSGFTWKAHLVAMLLPYTVLLAYLADARYSPAGRRWVAALLLGSFVLCSGTCDLLTHRGADYAEAFGLIAAGAILAAAGLVLVHRHIRQEPAQPGIVSPL